MKNFHTLQLYILRTVPLFRLDLLNLFIPFIVSTQNRCSMWWVDSIVNKFLSPQKVRWMPVVCLPSWVLWNLLQADLSLFIVKANSLPWLQGKITTFLFIGVNSFRKIPSDKMSRRNEENNGEK